jgi:hypothetical protein
VALVAPPHRQGYTMSIGPVNRPPNNQAAPVVRADANLSNQFRTATRTAQASTGSRSAETASQTSDTAGSGRADSANVVTGKQSGGDGNNGDGKGQQHKQSHNDDHQTVRTVYRNGQKVVLGTGGEVIRRTVLNEPQTSKIHFKPGNILTIRQPIVMMDMLGPLNDWVGDAEDTTVQELEETEEETEAETEEALSNEAARLAIDIWSDLPPDGIAPLTRFLRDVLAETDVTAGDIHIQLENLKIANPLALMFIRQALMTFYGDSQPVVPGRAADILAFLRGVGDGDRAFTLRVARRLTHNNLAIGLDNASRRTALQDIIEEFLFETPEPNIE